MSEFVEIALCNTTIYTFAQARLFGAYHEGEMKIRAEDTATPSFIMMMGHGFS